MQRVQLPLAGKALYCGTGDTKHTKHLVYASEKLQCCADLQCGAPASARRDHQPCPVLCAPLPVDVCSATPLL